MAEQTHSKKWVYVQSDKSAFTLTIHRFRANTGKRRTSSGRSGNLHPLQSISASTISNGMCASSRMREAPTPFGSVFCGETFHHDGRSRGDGRQTGAMESTAASRKSSLPLFPVEPGSVKIQTHLLETHKPTPRGDHFPPHCTKHSIGSVSTYTETLRICQVPFVRKAEKEVFGRRKQQKRIFFSSSPCHLHFAMYNIRLLHCKLTINKERQ